MNEYGTYNEIEFNQRVRSKISQIGNGHNSPIIDRMAVRFTVSDYLKNYETYSYRLSPEFNRCLQVMIIDAARDAVEYHFSCDLEFPDMIGFSIRDIVGQMISTIYPETVNQPLALAFIRNNKVEQLQIDNTITFDHIKNAMHHAMRNVRKVVSDLLMPFVSVPAYGSNIFTSTNPFLFNTTVSYLFYHSVRGPRQVEILEAVKEMKTEIDTPSDNYWDSMRAKKPIIAYAVSRFLENFLISAGLNQEYVNRFITYPAVNYVSGNESREFSETDFSLNVMTIEMLGHPKELKYQLTYTNQTVAVEFEIGARDFIESCDPVNLVDFNIASRITESAMNVLETVSAI